LLRNHFQKCSNFNWIKTPQCFFNYFTASATFLLNELSRADCTLYNRAAITLRMEYLERVVVEEMERRRKNE